MSRKPRAEDGPSTRCPVMVAPGLRCGLPVFGVDPRRTCETCRKAGAPPSLTYEEAGFKFNEIVRENG